MAGLSYAFDGNTETPQDVARRRALAEAIRGRTTSPRNVGEGFGAIASGIVANVNEGRANEAEQAGRTSANDTFSSLISGLTGGAPGYAPSQAPQSGAGTPGGGSSYRNAIASIESAGSGDYGAIGPTHPELGRALGRYQVMEANIGPWSQQALGREVTPEEFMASPEIQDAIFDHQFGNYVTQYGPEGAAQAWFGGEGGVGQLDRRDSLGTSIGDYTSQFNAAMGGQPQQMAQGPGLEELLMASQNPWLTDGQRSILNTMIEQQMAGPAQPDYDFMNVDGELVRTDATSGGVQSLGQFGQEDLTTAAQNYQYLLGQGMAPEQALERAFSGGQTINVGGNNDIGTIPAGKMVTRDENGNVTGMVDIPGGPTALEAEQAEDRQGVQAASDAEQAGTMLGVASQVRDIIENADQPTTGTNSRPFALHSGTPAGRIRALVVPLQSGVALNAMMRLKAASAQGATGFGAMNQQELGLLINEIGALNPDTTEPDIFLDTLGRIENRYKRVIEDIQANVDPERIQELGLQPIIDAVVGNGAQPQQPNQSPANPQVFNGTAQTGVQWRILD